MSKLKKNQLGFGVVEAVLILVIIGMLGFVGWYVWHAKQTTDKNLTTSSSTIPTYKKTTSTNYFTIKEWGVKAAYSGSLTLQYVIDTQNANNAWVGSKELAAADPAHCSPGTNYINAGYIGRYLPTDNIPTVGGPSETAQAYVSQDFKASNSNPPAYSKVGNYYYIYWTGQSRCSTITPEPAVQNQTYDDLTKIVDSLRAS